jgi:hypothetical protein
VAVAQTNEGQRNFADLQKKYDPKRQQLKTLSDEIDNLTKQLQAQGDKLSPAEQPAAPRSSTTRRSRPSAMLEDAQNDFQQEMQEMNNGLASKVYDVLVSYAQQQGFTLVLDVSSSSSRRSRCFTPALHQHHQGHHRRLQPEVGCARSAAARQPRRPSRLPPAQAAGLLLPPHH